MPFGVSRDFLTLAEDGQRRRLLELVPLAVGAILAGSVAELLDPARFGVYSWLFVASLGAGLGVGGIGGWLQTRAWADSFREGWTEWMHSAVGAGSMREVARRAGARAVNVDRTAAALLAALNVAVLVAAWFTLPPFSLATPYGAFAVSTVALTGLAIGARASLGLAEAWWCREIERQTLDLVEEGRVGVWGMR